MPLELEDNITFHDFNKNFIADIYIYHKLYGFNLNGCILGVIFK